MKIANRIFNARSTAYLILPFLALVTVALCNGAEGNGGQRPKDQTMLMFVGEAAPVITVASRRPENPASAPAVASIVEHTTVRQRGFRTLADILAAEPGFYMLRRARGSVPYLRGVPNGVLFLYDEVPITMDVTKDFHPLDFEMSLAGIKRVEIVRGPGSVLWGPDAFAGIINIVPMRGRDQPGIKTGLMGGSHGLHGAYLNLGMSGRGWDAFITGSALSERYYEDNFESRPFETQRIDPSHYGEVSANLHMGDWLAISGRIGTFERRYTMRDTGGITWPGKRRSPVDYIKLSLTKTLGPSHFSFTGYAQRVIYEITDVDLERAQRNHIVSAELLWDRRIMGGGLLTLGASFRKNNVTGAVVKGDFLPDFLKPENKVFVPQIQQADYATRLGSLFFQYRHTWANWSLWLGARYDKHSQYESTLSYSLGAAKALGRQWRIKAAYGTAYRSPYSSQLFGGSSFDPEAVSTFNLQLGWYRSPQGHLELTGFFSHLKDHISEDPYGGLSFPSERKILGLELDGSLALSKTLTLKGNVTLLNDYGDEEHYRALSYVFVSPDGTKRSFYDNWVEPFDSGPSFISNMAISWAFGQGSTLTLEGQKTSSLAYSYAKDTTSGHYHQPLLVNLAFQARDVLVRGANFTLRIQNLFDSDYKVPGLYGPVQGDGITVFGQWTLHF